MIFFCTQVYSEAWTSCDP